ncbi:MAG: methylthioadenosine phosphorylase [Deltaproteobacteria bacterium RIFCSPHIGHO2_12_FULL_43_9]|nr:MAG: methylthioadenosine phosphorylase [Deltaproteobacteria bacterium RIFCSPHIGHO2_12_FULL_43_9]
MEGLSNKKEVSVKTPFGAPSDAIHSGTMNDVKLLFLPRHGKAHRHGPSEVNYRANIYALKKLGAEKVISLSAVGSLKKEIKPGDIVLVDQFIDRTKGIRPSTFFEDGIVAHVGLGDPTCDELRGVLRDGANAAGATLHVGGIYVCIEGPQFSTRAESNLYRSWNADVIGMTNIPESKLAREAELCYATVALATDYDSWHEEEEAVSALKVLEVIAKNVSVAKKIIKETSSRISKTKKCTCGASLQHAFVTRAENIPKETYKRLELIIGKYIKKNR